MYLQRFGRWLSRHSFHTLRALRPWCTLALTSGMVLAGLAHLGSSASLEPTSAAGNSPVYPLKVGPTGRYLVDQANEPFFINGDAVWSLIAQGTNADIDTYLTNRQQHGVNVVLANLIEHQFATNAPKNINGDPPFTGAPFTTPNEAYFAHADYAINGAAQRGMVVMVDALYLGFNCGSEGWCAEIQTASTSDLQTWGQYVGNRYRNFNNIIWVVGADADPTQFAGVAAKLGAFATALNQTDGRHVMTAHNVVGEMAITPWPGATWLTLNSTYQRFGSGTYQGAQAAYNVSPTKPFFQIEGYYENEHGMSAQQLRTQAYWTVLSGGTGYVFGNCPMWGMGAPQLSAFCPSQGTNWQAQLNSSGIAGMQNVMQLFTQRAWQNLVPDFNHTTLIAGFGTNGGGDWAPAERTSDGSLAIAYLPTPRTVTVDLSQLSGAVTARWYDPSAGTFQAIGGSPFGNSGTQQFVPPGNNASGGNDWVLLLEASPAGQPSTLTPTPSATATQTATQAVATATRTATQTVTQAVATATPTQTAAPAVITSTSTPTSLATVTPTRTPNPPIMVGGSTPAGSVSPSGSSSGGGTGSTGSSGGAGGSAVGGSAVGGGASGGASVGGGAAGSAVGGGASGGASAGGGGGGAAGGTGGGSAGGGSGGASTTGNVHSQSSSLVQPAEPSAQSPSAVSVAGVSTGVLASVAANGGQFSYEQMSIDVPSGGAGVAGGTIQITRVDPLAVPAQGFQVSQTYSLTFTDSSSGAQMTQLPLPWTVEYRVSPNDMSQIGGDMSRLRLATLTADGSWIAADCSASGSAVECYLPHLSVIAALITPPVGDGLDSPLPGGWFFKQANGFNGTGDAGFSVVDDADASLWTEFQRLGGVDRLGYPVSQRYVSDGLITQAFQRAILQWAPDAGQARLVNVMRLFTAAGLDAWLDEHRQVPPGGDVAGDMAVLADQPALRAIFDADPGIAATYGLPLAVKSYNGLVTARLDRAYLQLWTVDTSWAPAGTVTIGGAGELARSMGQVPTSALAPGVPQPVPSTVETNAES